MNKSAVFAMFAQSLVFTERALAFSIRIQDLARTQRIEKLLATGYDFLAARGDRFAARSVDSVPRGRKRDLVHRGVENARSKRLRTVTAVPGN